MRFKAITLSAALSLAATGCGQGQNGTEALRDGSRGAGASTTPKAERPREILARTRSALPAAVSGTSLPRAKPSGSALFNAAYHRSGSDWEQLLFLCDGVNGERVRLLTTPNARGLSQMWTYAKPSFAPASEEVRIDDEDPGAGQILRELQRPNGGAIGSIHSINPSVVGSPDVTTLPTLSRITAGSEITACRWMERGRVLFVDAKRTVLITAEPRGSYTYRSFDHAKPGAPVGGTSSIPTAAVKGGRLVGSQPRLETYEFKAGPWTYRLTASADNRTPGATLAVLRAGKVAMTSTAVAYEMAASRME